MYTICIISHIFNIIVHTIYLLIYINISTNINMNILFCVNEILFNIGVAEFKSASDAERVAEKLDGTKFQGELMKYNNS